MKSARDLSTPALARAYRSALRRLHSERKYWEDLPGLRPKQIEARYDRAKECRDELNRRGWSVP